MAVLEELKKRKIVQWALAYLAGAWVVLQLVAILAGQFGWPGWVERSVTILLAFGFFVALVLAWYHGEQGRQRVSGPELLMVAGILVAAGATVALVRGDPGAGVPEPGPEGARAGSNAPPGRESPRADDGLVPVTERSVAVLPLDDLSPGGEHGYFAGAMTEEITSALSKVPDLRVTSRNSAAKFTASGLSVREFARRLRVAHVLEGSVQRVSDRVRITVQLIDARRDQHLWSKTYDREITSVIDVQVDIAEEIADRLAASFSERERRRILAGSSRDPVAYDLFLQSQQFDVDFAGPDAVDEAIRLLRRATRRDPGFSLAWAQLSFLYALKANLGGRAWADSSGAALDRAIEATTDSSFGVMLRAYRTVFSGEDRQEGVGRLREAVASHPGSYPLVISLARLRHFTGDLPEVARWYRRAAALDPLNADPWISLAEVYGQVGLYRHAEGAVRRAVDVAPNSPWPWLQLADVHVALGDHEAALATADSLEERAPDLGPAVRGWTYLLMDDRERAATALEPVAASRLGEGLMGRYLLPMVAHLRLVLGDSAGGRRMLERAESRIGTGGDVVPAGDEFLQLKIAAIRGDTSAAVDALREYIEQGGRSVYEIRRSPLFGRVRADSAFQAELAGLERRVVSMRRRIERDLQREPWEDR